MAYLGIILHAGFLLMYYSIVPPLNTYNISLTSFSIHVVGAMIHFFRMPIFFIIAGYFASQQLSAKPISIYMYDRFKRIMIPFFLSLLILNILFNSPLIVVYILSFFQSSGGTHDIQKKFIVMLNNLWHYWFLYYLLWFYTITIVMVGLRGPLNSIFYHSQRCYQWALSHSLTPLVFVLITFALTCTDNNIESHYSFHWIPEWNTFFLYLVFYGFGYILQKTKISVDVFQPYCKKYLTCGLMIASFLLYGQLTELKFILRDSIQSIAVFNLMYNLCIWLMTLGLLGLLSYCRNDNKIIRYLSKSSYWVYLSHLPILIMVMPLMASHKQSIGAVYFGSIVITMMIVLISYHIFIRKKSKTTDDFSHTNQPQGSVSAVI